MPSRPHLSPAAIRALLVAAGLCVLGIALVIIGWPEQFLWQSVLLQVSWLAFDAAVAVVLWHAIRALRLRDDPSPSFRICWLMLIGGVGLGLVLYVIALVSKHAMLTPLGQLCIAVGLGAMSCYVAASAVQPRGLGSIEATPELDALLDDDEFNDHEHHDHEHYGDEFHDDEQRETAS